VPASVLPCWLLFWQSCWCIVWMLPLGTVYHGAFPKIAVALTLLLATGVLSSAAYVWQGLGTVKSLFAAMDDSRISGASRQP
jgi:hypothetical protein